MKKLIAAFAFCSVIASANIVAAQTESKPGTDTLPNGASSLSETYGLWSVNCALQDGNKYCGMGRQEINNQNQPVVNLSASTDKDGGVSGALIVPFGILVSKPIVLQVDDSKTVINTAVRTCMPQGCLVPVSFDKNTIAALRAGKALKISATSAGNGEPKIDNLFVQLEGFGGALDRLIALKK